MLLFALSSSAFAYGSDPRDLLLSDEVDVFAAAEYDTGPIPVDSPVWVRVYIASDGGASTSMQATSLLEWPEALTHRIASVPNTGVFSLLTDITMAVEVGFDVFGYTSTIPLWSQNLTMYGDKAFDGLLLPDSAPARVVIDTAGPGIDTINYTFSVFTGVDVAVTLDVFPHAYAELEGEKIITTDGINTNAILSESESSTFHVNEDYPGVLPLESTYYGWMDSQLDVTFQPSVDVCVVVVGCVNLAKFDIPVPLVSGMQPRAFVPVAYEHPLPSLLPTITNHDFGDVELGSTTNLEIALKNIGQLDLDGVVTIEGDPSFTVFPDTFFAAGGATDGLVVTYTPSDASQHSATLVLDSNDPLRPRIEIPLVGHAEEVSDDVGGDVVSESVKTCGCASPATLAAWPAAIVGLLSLRRRRSRA
jgi:hypothetical protein